MSARMLSTVSRTLASAALIAPASIPRLSQRGMFLSSYSRAVVPAKAGTHGHRPHDDLRCQGLWVPGLLRCARSPGTTAERHFSLSYFIACGLIGDPVPPVMISGGPQKKNS